MDRPKRQRKAATVLEESQNRNEIAKKPKVNKNVKKPKAVNSASHAKKPTRCKVKINDESVDEIYDYMMELKKKQKKDARSRLKVKKALDIKLQSSTPTQTTKGQKKKPSAKGILFAEVSPIRRSAVNTNLTNDDDGSILIKKANKENIEHLESSNIQALKDMIAELRIKRELSALNALEESSGIDSILREVEEKQSKAIQSPDQSPPAKIEKIERKKTVFFAPEVEDNKVKISSPITLKPGKWRKSLAAWRKSHMPMVAGRRNSHRIVGLFPIKTDPNVIKRYTERLEESLATSAVLLEQSDEGLQIPGELSILDSSVECASLQEPTTFVAERKTSKRETSVFKRSSIFYGLQSPLIKEVDVLTTLSARQIVLRRCGQQEPLLFDDIYSESQLPNSKKIGEGVYGEVFCYTSDDNVPIVLKIIPIEGDLLVNGEQQKRFDEILTEVLISMELSGLRNGSENKTDGFVNVKRVTCVKGAYPQHLIEAWEIFNDSSLKGSENDHPEVFGEDQLYIVFELCNAGIDLEAYQFKHAEEAFSVFLQVALTLAVAENKFEFEHRDLHWGNILVAKTSAKYAEYCVDGNLIKVPTHGVKATIIDYTLSRMVYDGAVLYFNLANDEDLFGADGDYQFDIYRLMRDRVKNNFKLFEPFTNILWLHYLLDKLIDGARYKTPKNEKHKSAVSKIMHLRDDLLEFKSASQYVESLPLQNY